MKKRRKYLPLDRIELVMNEGLAFPIFYVDDLDEVEYDNVSDIKPNSVMYIEDIGEESPLGLPEHIDLVRENADGLETFGRYILVESSTEYPNPNSSKEN